MTRPNGAVIDLQVALTPWRVDGKSVGITSVSTDITERKEAERELERLAQAAEHRADAVISTDLDMRIANPDSGPEFEFDFRILAGQRRQERVLHEIGHADPDRPGCYQGTFQDVSAQRRAEAAQAANQAKSEFLSRISHELRTPLNAISGFGQLLAMDDLAPQQAEHVGYVLKGANHMLALVDDVLECDPSARRRTLDDAALQCPAQRSPSTDGPDRREVHRRATRAPGLRR